MDSATRIQLAIAHDQLEQAICDVEKYRGELDETKFDAGLGLYWRSEDRVWFWNAAARMLA
jgi:hypothetical protein